MAVPQADQRSASKLKRVSWVSQINVKNPRIMHLTEAAVGRAAFPARDAVSSLLFRPHLGAIPAKNNRLFAEKRGEKVINRHETVIKRRKMTFTRHEKVNKRHEMTFTRHGKVRNATR